MAKVTKIREKYIVSEGDYAIVIEIDHNGPYIHILNEDEEAEFVFKDSLCKDTLQRWEIVSKLIVKGIKYIKEKEYGQKKIIYTEPKIYTKPPRFMRRAKNYLESKPNESPTLSYFQTIACAIPYQWNI
jgi:hypothetical protein